MFSQSLNTAQSETYIRTAQLEWLFGERRRYAPPERVRSSAPSPSSATGASGEGPRYITVPRRDFFGNVTYERVLAPESKRMPKIDSKNDRIRHAVAEKLRAAPPAPPTKGPLLITVSIAKQQLTLYDQGVAIAQSPVSSGTQSHPTPTGVFSVIQKQYFHRSNMYSSAPMPYMQRITWAGVALHAGELPGYAASHGCIRLPEDFAIRLWGTTQPGVRVIVTQNEVKPVEISHPVLFKPKSPEAAPAVSPEPVPLPPSRDLPPPEPVTPKPVPQAKTDAPAERAAAADLVGATPVSLLEEIADTVPVVAEITIVRGGQAAALRADEAHSIVTGEHGMRTERIAVVRGGQPVEYQIVDLPPVSHDVVATASPAADSVAANAQEQIADADDVSAEDIARLALPDLGTMPPVLLAYAGNDFMQFARYERRAESEPQTQPADVPLPVARPLRPGPVSVYISRRQQRIYVRKGFEAVFDMPITISRADVPMGTHVFTANALTSDNAAFRWNVVSLSDNAFGKRATSDDGKSARAALDRIQLPQEAVTRISEIIDVGATLIVTDKGPGRAQSPDNDFSVVLR